MRKHLLQLIPAALLVLLFGFQQGMAQEKKSSKVHITITEDDKVTSDTTFELAEGQDPEMIKKIVGHLAGGEIHEKHMSQDVHVSHSGDKQMVWVSKGDHEDIMHKHMDMDMMSDINIDSIKEAHGDAKVLVIKNKDGEVTVKELDDEHEMHFGDDDHGHHEMVFIEGDEEGNVFHVKKSKSGEKIMMIHEMEGDHTKEHKVIIHTDDDGEGKEKKIEVFVYGDEGMEWVEKGEGDEDVEVYVIKKGDGDAKVVKKKIRVEIEEEDEAEEVDVKEKKKKKK
jgi:hypothetical protein